MSPLQPYSAGGKHHCVISEITFKLACFVYKVLIGGQPAY